jgi:hypothetical protein
MVLDEHQGTYRELPYVVGQVEVLAEQLLGRAGTSGRMSDSDAEPYPTLRGEHEQKHVIVNGIFSGHVGRFLYGRNERRARVWMVACPLAADQDWHVDDVEVLTVELFECPGRA